MSRPLARWIVGPINYAGLQCLHMSVSKFRHLYPEFDLLLCYNQIKPENLAFGLPLYDQSQSPPLHGAVPSGGYNVHWKLYPPRLRQDAHEIIIDNDLVLFKRVPEIDLFLSESKSTLLCQGLRGLHGSFARHIPKGIQINSGLFGMPPHFDFEDISKQFLQQDKLIWKDRFDEQGLVAATLLKNKEKIIISMVTIPILEPNFDIHAATTKTCCGYHFVSLNYKDHGPWQSFRANTLLL
jgi:hypothetical protein